MSSVRAGRYGTFDRTGPANPEQPSITAEWEAKVLARQARGLKRRRTHEVSPAALDNGQDAGADQDQREEFEEDLPETRARDRTQDRLSHERHLRSQAELQRVIVLSLATTSSKLRQELVASQLRILRSAAEAYSLKPLHQCGSEVQDISTGTAQRCEETRPITIFFLGYSVRFELPSFQCSCGKFELPPAALMCFGSSPAKPTVLYDAALLDLFHSLSLRKGMSASAMAASMNDVIDHISLLNGTWHNDGMRSTSKALLSAHEASRLCFRYGIMHPSVNTCIRKVFMTLSVLRQCTHCCTDSLQDICHCPVWPFKCQPWTS